MVYIYILKLEKNKYYVGKTDKPEKRVIDHFTTKGSNWTKKYKPIKLLEIIPNCDDYDEDKYTRIYMDKYGINNVRGGSFVSMKLNETEIDILEKMQNGTTNKCFKCGKSGHYAKYCKVKYYQDDSDSSDEYYIDCDSDSDSSDDQFTNTSTKYSNNSRCYRCGRSGHYSSSCYASTHVKGYYINN